MKTQYIQPHNFRVGLKGKKWFHPFSGTSDIMECQDGSQDPWNHYIEKPDFPVIFDHKYLYQVS